MANRSNVERLEARFERWDEGGKEWVGSAISQVVPGEYDPAPLEHWLGVLQAGGPGAPLVNPGAVRVAAQMRRVVAGREPEEFGGWRWVGGDETAPLVTGDVSTADD